MPLPKVPRAKYSFKVHLAAWCIHGVVRIVSKTWKFEWVDGEETFRRIRESGDPVIVCAWHNRMLGNIAFIYRHWSKRGIPMGVLISRSRDGDIGSRVGELLGGTIIRGSPNRGALGSLKALIRLVRNERISTIIFPDGSRGPKYRAKIGPVGLARIAGAPLAPMSWDADRKWVLEKSWDQYRIPKPFATIRIAWGEPIDVPKSADEDRMEAQRKALEERLIALGRRVETDSVTPA